MLDVTLDAPGLIKMLDHMQDALRGLPIDMANEMTEWQSADMHRSWPYTKIRRRRRIRTVIWPRGIGRSKHSFRLSMKPGRRARVNRGFLRAQTMARRTKQGGRPILRDELFDALRQRMVELMQKSLTWQ